MTNTTEKFFELIQITLGNRETFSEMPNEKEWAQLYLLATKQSLASVLLEGLEKVSATNRTMGQNLLLEWIGVQQMTVSSNSVHNERSKELYDIFKKGGYRSCVLKGQGTALYYDKPENRQCGDIDIWVEGDRDKLLNFVREKGYHVGHVDIKHSDIDFFDDVPVEVHFLPSWMYSPFTNRRLQKFLGEKAEIQYSNFDEKLGFTHSTIDFDVVYSMVHIYRHIFSEGIGLRQLVDYYYILQRSTEEERIVAFDVLCRLKMKSFVGGVMWILMECFGMNTKYSLCPVNVRHGKFLLSEIMKAGSFGHFDYRIKQIDHDKKFKRGFFQLRRNLRFVSYYPSEVLWSPFWKLWHWGWRKKKGYL